MLAHLRSVLLAAWSLASILVAFPVSYFVYRVAFGVEWLGIMQILVP